MLRPERRKIFRFVTPLVTFWEYISHKWSQKLLNECVCAQESSLVCAQDVAKSCQSIWTELCGKVDVDPRKKWLNSGTYPAVSIILIRFFNSSKLRDNVFYDISRRWRSFELRECFPACFIAQSQEYYIAFIGVCVRLSVCPHDKTKTAENKVTFT